MTPLSKGTRSVRSQVARFVSAFRTMYYACRTDYPCEGCEQPRFMAFRNALGWAWRYR